MYVFLMVRKAFKKARIAREMSAVTKAIQLQNIADQAAGYGFEIGKGKPLQEVLSSSPDNPFLDPSWRERVIPNGE